MKGVRLQDIPKRKSFHVNVQSLPSNAKYYAPEEDEDGILMGFSLKWLRAFPELSGIDFRDILVAMSDGSLSADKHGGCGFFAALLSFVDGTAEEAALLKEMRRTKFDRVSEMNNDPPNGISNYISSSTAVARRTSIEFCELKGVESMLQRVVDFVAEIHATTTVHKIRLLSLSVDSQSEIRCEFAHIKHTLICSTSSLC